MIQSTIVQVGRTALSCLGDTKLWLAVPFLAVLSTLMAVSGMDAAVNSIARMQPDTVSIAWSAFPMLAGIAMPVLVPLAIAWRLGKQPAATCLGVLLATVVVVLLCKLATSRISPEALFPDSVFDRSTSIRFGLFAAGPIESLIEGWPSGHAANNAAVAIIAYRLSERALIKNAAIVWIVWVFFATVFGISGDVHWLSDSVSGLTIGLLTSAMVPLHPEVIEQEASET